MSVLSYIALTGCLMVLGMGFLTTWADRGYRFDLRRRNRRGRARIGGRREQDLSAARKAL